MKRKHIQLALLIAILFLNIIFAKYIVHQFFLENYKNTLIFAGLNLILFPVAIFIYKLQREHKEIS